MATWLVAALVGVVALLLGYLIPVGALVFVGYVALVIALVLLLVDLSGRRKRRTVL